MSRSRSRRAVGAGLAVLGFVGGIVGLQATPAFAAPFSMSLVGGSLGLGSQAATTITIFGDNTLELGAFSAETSTVTVTGPGVRDGIGTVRILNDDT